MNPDSPKISYHVKAHAVEACNCQHGCNCQFTGFPNEGKCEFIMAYEVTDGRVGTVSLNGVRAVVAGKYPKAIHEGNGHIVLFVDDRASNEQASAFARVLSGQLGGMPWEAIAATVVKFDGPIRKPIEIMVAAERSFARVPGAIELELTPIRDVVSGEPKEIHIVYPKGGFFWDDARIATTTRMRAVHHDFRLEWPGKYASAAEVNWTNE